MAIPFAVLTSSRIVGGALVGSGLCAIPEERDLPWELAALIADDGTTPTLQSDQPLTIEAA